MRLAGIHKKAQATLTSFTSPSTTHSISNTIDVQTRDTPRQTSHTANKWSFGLSAFALIVCRGELGACSRRFHSRGTWTRIASLQRHLRRTQMLYHLQQILHSSQCQLVSGSP